MKLLKKLILNIFILCYIFLIYFSGMPASNTLNLKLKKITEKVTLMVGIWPSWSMFAPNPIKHDSKAIALIRYKNGVVDEFDVEIKPQEGLGPLRKSRWMKYSQDNLTHANQRQLLNPAINYFYHKFQSPLNPIVSISIKRKWWNVPTFSESRPLIPLLTKVNRAEQSEILATKQF